METAQKEELVIVKRVIDDKYNLIGENGKLLLDEWYDFVSDFFGEVAVVVRDDGDFNFINKQGKFLSEQWFEWIDDFHEGFARVQRTNGEWAKIDKTGKIVVSK